MHIDFKITTWERVEIPKEEEEYVMKLMKEGKITSANDLYDHESEEKGYIDYYCKQLMDTSEQMTPHENGGHSTIEVWQEVSNKNGGMDCTWQNEEE